MVLSRSTWVWLWAGLGLAALSQYLQWVSGIYSFIAPHSLPLADLAVAGILGGTAAAGLAAPLVAAGWPTAKYSKPADTTAAAG